MVSAAFSSLRLRPPKDTRCTQCRPGPTKSSHDSKISSRPSFKRAAGLSGRHVKNGLGRQGSPEEGSPPAAAAKCQRSRREAACGTGTEAAMERRPAPGVPGDVRPGVPARGMGGRRPKAQRFRRVTRSLSQARPREQRQLRSPPTTRPSTGGQAARRPLHATPHTCREPRGALRGAQRAAS